MPIPAAPLMIGSIGGLALGGLGLLSQSKANQQNMALNREMLDFQKYQYSDMKRYNSIQEQVRRMKAAGLNPSLLLQNGTTGMAGNSVASPSPTPMQAYDMGSMASGISDIANTVSQSDINLAQKKNIEADTTQKEIENIFKFDKEFFGLEKLKAEGFHTGNLAKLVENEVKLANSTLDSRIQQQKIQTEIMANKFEADVIARGYLPDQLQADLALKMANQKLAVQTGMSSVQQAAAAIMDAVTRRNRENALTGFNDSDRKKFFEATYDYLNSGTFANTSWEEGTNIGNPILGVSHHGRSNHASKFNEWKNANGKYLKGYRK